MKTLICKISQFPLKEINKSDISKVGTQPPIFTKKYMKKKEEEEGRKEEERRRRKREEKEEEDEKEVRKS
jgi:ribosomal protein L12E/L44/L45/RPP1/RPP2